MNLEEEKERLRWEGFAGNGGFKPGMNLFITHEAAKINQSINQLICRYMAVRRLDYTVRQNNENIIRTANSLKNNK